MSFTDQIHQNQSHKDHHQDPCLHALIQTCGHTCTAVLNAACDLNLFDIIAKGSPNNGGGLITVSEIASQLPVPMSKVSTSKLDRVLRFLVSFSVLTCSARSNEEDGSMEKLYGLSPTGKYFLKKQDGTPAWASLFPKLSYHPYMARVWLHCKEAVLDGGVDIFKKLNGQRMYEYVEKDVELKNLFQRTMAEISALHMEKILEVYKGFEGISQLVDVAGGIGQSLMMIISKYPSLHGVNFDLPRVVQDAPHFPGLTHVGGDMFKSVPEGEAIMIKGTTHNWSDEKCVLLFRNCREALKEGGKVIVIDLMMPQDPEMTMSAKYLSLLDSVMLLQGGGMERTEKEFEILCKRAGFSRFNLACRALSNVLGVMEFYK
ncbi:isoliquiritigenin 2'-O-methyltransferase-like [Prosopis cineraria]|uniref:isoliquiritigenin 2'-O-methyltransferase-like n=1 Tax=Prosopis cineraria TaxID=364024 RepID=UPI0024102D3F|nr:isoliquiritigenin 2'-O-methyltransferase-like [Prosopis cineraria]